MSRYVTGRAARPLLHAADSTRTGGVLSLSSRATKSSGRSKAPPKEESVCVQSGRRVCDGQSGGREEQRIKWRATSSTPIRRDKRTRDSAERRRMKAFDGISRKAAMKLDQLDSATKLYDLDLPGNRLEALKGETSRLSITTRD